MWKSRIIRETIRFCESAGFPVSYLNDGSISEDIEYSSSSGDESSLEQPTFIFWLIFTIPSLTVRHYDFSHLRIEHGRLLYYTVKISRLQII